MWSNTTYPPYFIDKVKEKVKYIDSNLNIDASSFVKRVQTKIFCKLFSYRKQKSESFGNQIQTHIICAGRKIPISYEIEFNMHSTKLNYRKRFESFEILQI